MRKFWRRLRVWWLTKKLLAEFRSGFDSFSFHQFQKPNPKEQQ